MNPLAFLLGRRTAAAARHGASNRLPALEYPLQPWPRIAVLGLAVRQESGIAVFPEWSNQNLPAVNPRALAGWLPDLEHVARLRDSGRLALPELSFPLLVFSTPEDGPLTEIEHDRLWTAFKLPVFEQIRTRDGQLVAVECDSKHGFHSVTAPHSRQQIDLCPCGTASIWQPQPECAYAAAGGD